MNSPLEIVETIDSTTSELLRRPDLAPGAALLALSQTGGRGRSERVWQSPPGGMYLSVAIATEDPRGLSLLGALALLEVASEFGVQGQLRWPNDVTVRGRKLGGVLPVVRYSGNKLERAVLGVGLNVNSALEEYPSELRPTLTTLAREVSQPQWDIVEVARSYQRRLGRRLQHLQREGLAELVALCQPHLEGLDDQSRPVLVEEGKASVPLARVEKLAPDGALCLQDGSRLESLGRDQRLRFQHEGRSTSAHPI